MSMPDVTPHIAKREWEAPNLGIASIAANIDRRHQVWIADLVVRVECRSLPWCWKVGAYSGAGR